MWVFMSALCKLSSEAPGYMTKILPAENGQKIDKFEPIYLGNYQYWWKMVFDFWEHYQPPFLVIFVYPTLNSLLFSFSFHAIYF